MFSLSLALLLFSGGVVAKVPRCDISNAAIPLPPNQNMLLAPTSSPSFIGLAIGIQNYTCGSTGTYTNVGAVAELFDVSCLYGTPEFPFLQDIAFAAWKFAPHSSPIQSIVAGLDPYHASFVLGQHYFVNASSGTGLSPVWDFRPSFPGNSAAFVVAAKVGDVPAPSGPPDVDWLSLNGVQGQDTLATQVFRVSTVGGLAPAPSCTPGSPEITVKYSSMYWLYGSTVQQ
ncbi:hypothetical protein C8F01DRAFT_1249710 [Mycena amicta]|nr:hypothetical protein C8F01DRAFT_1249710 [Mycena amicta]